MDPQSVFCEVCLKRVAKSDALTDEARDHVAYFCGATCYERWRGQRRPAPAPHPQREEPRADSVEPGDVPPS